MRDAPPAPGAPQTQFRSGAGAGASGQRAPPSEPFIIACAPKPPPAPSPRRPILSRPRTAPAEHPRLSASPALCAPLPASRVPRPLRPCFPCTPHLCPLSPGCPAAGVRVRVSRGQVPGWLGVAGLQKGFPGNSGQEPTALTTLSLPFGLPADSPQGRDWSRTKGHVMACSLLTLPPPSRPPTSVLMVPGHPLWALAPRLCCGDRPHTESGGGCNPAAQAPRAGQAPSLPAPRHVSSQPEQTAGISGGLCLCSDIFRGPIRPFSMENFPPWCLGVLAPARGRWLAALLA